jgi:hypothetical protein
VLREQSGEDYWACQLHYPGQSEEGSGCLKSLVVGKLAEVGWRGLTEYRCIPAPLILLLLLMLLVSRSLTSGSGAGRLLTAWEVSIGLLADS